jgi:hypothetical protein
MVSLDNTILKIVGMGDPSSTGEPHNAGIRHRLTHRLFG